MKARKPTRQLGLDLGAAGRPQVTGAGFLRWIEYNPSASAEGFPFDIPAFRHLQRLEFHPAVTFFIGENGTGKSTLLEAIAVKAGFDALGGWKRRITEKMGVSSALDPHLKLARGGYPGDGWFLRAESFHEVATELESLGSNFSAYGGKSLHEQSHGEAFLALLAHRLSGDGLYLFDEPEAALSPQRQLAVLSLLHRLVRHHSQLVIATHSPILLAYPHARIYQFSERGLQEVAYQETEHFQVTRDFLLNPDRMVDLLLREEEDDGR